MKDKSFQWVLKQLLHSNCKLPILNTYICSNKTIQAKFSVNSEMELTEQYLSRPVAEFIKESIRPVELFYKSVTSRIDASSEFPSVLCYLQIPCLSDPIRYTFSVIFSQNGFIGSLSKDNCELKNIQIYAKAKDLTTVVINSIEKMSCMRVISLEIEFLETLDKQLWLSKILNCSIMDEADIPKDSLSSVSDILKLKKRSRSSMPKLGKAIPCKRKTPVQPLKILSPEHSFSETSIKEERSFKNASKQARMSKVFLEYAHKTNLTLKKQKTINEEDIQTEHERFKKISRPSAHIKVESFLTPQTTQRDEPKFSQKHISVHTIKCTKLNKKINRKCPSQMEIQKRKAFLINQFLSKGSLAPHVSLGYIGRYKECFKPIRIVR